jgi:hypothetical protein
VTAVQSLCYEDFSDDHSAGQRRERVVDAIVIVSHFISRHMTMNQVSMAVAWSAATDKLVPDSGCVIPDEVQKLIHSLGWSYP